MSSYLLLKYAHLIAFVYWLGGDLGTFIASRQVVNDRLSREARQTALKIMLACDLGPKLAMPLILPLGLHLASMTGVLPVTGMLVALGWLVGAYWSTVVLILYLNEGKPFTAGLSRFDLYFRIAVVISLLGWAGWLITNESGVGWARIKVVLFALMVCCGIAIRIHLKPFVPAFMQMVSGTGGAEADATMARSIARCRPWVWLIWAGLFTNAALGIQLIG